MLAYRLLYLISLVTFTFGALTFSVLTLSYWKERRSQRARRGGPVFPTFTLFCAAAFVLNLVLAGAGALAPDAAWVTVPGVALDFVAGLLPPLLFHFIYRQEASGLPFRRAWGWVAAGLYLAGAAAALAHNLPAWSDRWESVPAWMLSLTAALALLLLILTRRPVSGPGRRQRWWYRVLFGLTVLCAAFDLAHPADYLLLAFFCVTLYYQERLVFFDLFIKRGAFFAVSLAGLTLFLATAPAVYQRFPADWSRPWIAALLLTPFWLMAPWIYWRLADAIDRVGLGRPYPAPEAERLFIAAVQLSATEDELRSRAIESLGHIFQTAAEVRFDPAPGPAIPDEATAAHTPAETRLAPATGLPAATRLDAAGNGLPAPAAAPEPAADDGLLAPIEQRGACAGWLTLPVRPNAIPFLSDDRRLLQSLARTLGVVLENVRFREQQRRQEQREQELRLLASRAELKALRAQINPHFLFNALNAIAGLIPDQPQLADETVEQLAQVFRYTLRKSEKEWARLDEEVEFVAAYLRVEQARFGARLRVDFDVDSAAHAVAVPAMSIQPLVENAIRHGVSAVEGPGTVGLRVAIADGALAVEVFDNGPGFPPGYSLAQPGHGAHGLRNIAERLRGYYGGAARIWWESGPGGTRVFLKIPRHTEEPN